MALRPWTPQDLPADFKLVWYHIPDSATVSLDANSKIASVANKFTNKANPATTRNEARRNSIRKSNGYDTAYGDGNQYGILVSDLTGFPTGNADRFMMLVAVNDGGSVLWGYKHDNGGSNYWVDSDFSLKCNSNTGLNGGAVSRNVLHTYVANHKDGITTLRLDGVQRARGAVTITGVTPANESVGIKGAQENFFTFTGGTLAAMYSTRAATADEMYLIEYWYAGFTGQAIPADNPYRNNPPMVDDGTGAERINLDAAITEAADTVAASAAVRITATAQLIEQPDTVSSATIARVMGAASLVETDDTLSAAAIAVIRAAVSTIEADDMVEASAGVRIRADAQLVERDDTIVSATIARITLNAALVEDDDQVEAMIGQVTVLNADIVEQDDTLSAESKAIVRATARMIETDDALVSRGYVGITGEANLVEQDDLMASAGVVRINGAADLVEANDTLSARITNTLQLRAVIQEQDDVLDAGVSIRVTLVADLVEADDQLAAYSGGPVEFEAVLVEDDDTITAAARVRVRARARMTEQPDTLSATWTIPVYAPPSRTALIQDTGPRSAVLADTGPRSVIV